MSEGNCKYDHEIMNLRKDIRGIRKDIKTLLAFKWQVFGSVGAMTFIIVTLVGVLKVIK